MPINRKMDEQNVVYPYNRMLSGNKKGILHAPTWINLKNMLESEKEGEVDKQGRNLLPHTH